MLIGQGMRAQGLMEVQWQKTSKATRVAGPCVRACLSACLQAFCSKHFPAGPTWNAAGIPASQFKAGAAAGAAANGAAANGSAAPAAAVAVKKPGGPPPPPPPPPPGSLLADRKPTAAAVAAPAAAAAGSGGGNGMAALLADISKGASVTSGLRKVTGGARWLALAFVWPLCCMPPAPGGGQMANRLTEWRAIPSPAWLYLFSFSFFLLLQMT